MEIRDFFTSSYLLKIIFAIALFMLIFISAISYNQTLSLVNSTDWVVQTYKVNVELETLLSHIKDAENGQRGFIITRDSTYLKPYFTAQVEVNHSFDALKVLTNENLKQKDNVESLYQLVKRRFGLLENRLTLVHNDTVPKAEKDQKMYLGNTTMDLIRSKINEMMELEMSYLKDRQARFDHDIAIMPIVVLLLMLFAIFVFVFAFWKINRDLHRLSNINAKLLIAAESVKHAEEIGGFSCWHWDLEVNKLTYSDNQYLMLGCKPQSFEPTIEKFLEFVHPHDKHIITEGADKVLNEGVYPAAYFRIIREDGLVRHFKSISRLITEENGKKILIGINSDVTEEYLNNLALEERNRELEISNKELASFNHVASHDLQEPLRIVQTYISRLEEFKESEMSERAREYFVRMKVSITRMRTLIDALLLFSRINKFEKVFERADLNSILDNSKLDLAQPIEEKKVVIESVKLPTLKVIPFQIQQLFTNILSNSLKYCNPNIDPLIQITCKKVIAKEQPELETDSTATFFKISIADNGLGFEQKYAKNIFTFFYRLHHDKALEGTGMGLAICKKIAERHGGYITASGIPNKGATFSIFLPAS